MHRPPRRDWVPALLCCSLCLWGAVSVFFASNLATLKHFGAFKGDLSGAPEGEEQQPPR